MQAVVYGAGGIKLYIAFNADIKLALFLGLYFLQTSLLIVFCDNMMDIKRSIN